MKSTNPRHAGLRWGAVVILGAWVGASGCTEPATAIDADVVAADMLTAGASMPGVTATVYGGAHYQLKDPPAFVGPFKWIYNFSFDVTKYADGTDTGTVKFRSRVPPGQNSIGIPLDWSADVNVDCIEVAGNTAWISGTIANARTDSPFGPPNGDIAMLIVQDNGTGQGADEVNVGPASSFGVASCRETPPIFPGAWTDGNVTVTTY